MISGRLSGPGQQPRGSPAGAGDCALVFAADEPYARALAVSMYSTLEHLSSASAPRIYVLDGGLSASSRRRLLDVLAAVGAGESVHWITGQTERIAKRTGRSPDSAAQFLRLLIPEMLPAQIRRAVYLDADVLVRRDVSPLFTIELGGAPIGAVRDTAVADTSHEWTSLRGRGRPRPYFNSGVLVMDLPRWRDTGLAHRVVRYAAESDPLPFSDQDPLNAVIASWHELDCRWNLQPWLLFLLPRLPPTELTEVLYRRRRHLYRSAAVLHFVGPKPWSVRCNTVGTMEWIRALMRSGWYTPSEAIAWLLPWLCRWTPAHLLWLCRRTVVRTIDASPVRAVRRHLGATRASLGRFRLGHQG